MKAYEELESVKENEIVVGQKQSETKIRELACTDEKLCGTKVNFDQLIKAFML